MDNYHILGRIGEGAHGKVYKAKRVQSAELVAIKKVPLKNLDDGFPKQVTTNQNSLFRSRDWLLANQGPVFPGLVGSWVVPLKNLDDGFPKQIRCCVAL